MNKAVLLIYIYNCWTVALGDLKLCSQPTNVTKLCKKMGNYKANSAPKPWPVIVTPIVDLKNVLDVDQDKKSLTIYVYLITQWIDPEIFVHTPDEIE